MSTKILITGGSGFLGQNIIQEIRKKYKNWEVYNLSKTEINDKKIKNIKIDATKIDFSKIKIQFDYIINTLALSNNKYCDNLELAEKINIEFTKNLLLFAKDQKKLKKIIHISSIILYDNKNTPPVNEDDKLYFHYNNYSFTKGIAEEYVRYYCKKFELPIIIFRLSNIYGEHQQFVDSPFLIPSKIMQGLKENKIEVFDFKPKRDWIYSSDAAKGILASLKSEYCGTLNLGSGKRVSVKQIINEISRNLKIPATSMNITTNGPMNFYCNIKKTKDVLKWEPKIDIETGIKKTIKYIKSKQKI